MSYESALTVPGKRKADIVTEGNYHFFYGGPYSQWAPSEFDFCGVHFNTAEQFMMLGKAIVAGNDDFAAQIMAALEPSQQKALGRKIPDFPVKEWNFIKYDIVLLGNFLKFTQCGGYNNHLMKTEDPTIELFVEASPTDKIWGIGLSEFDAQGTTPDQWKGENLLGKVVTEIRDLLYYGHPFPGATFAKLDSGYAAMHTGMRLFGMV